MGCYLNHREKQLTLCSQQKIVTSQEIDLPYRHYIKRGVYIPSALPHGHINFIKGCRFVKLQDLWSSTILQRRIQKKLIIMD